MSSAATDASPTLRERVGGRWFGSWAMWAICMPGGLAVLASDLASAQSPGALGRWLFTWALATGADALVLFVLQRTVLRHRASRPWPVWGVVAAGAAFGLCYAACLYGASFVAGVTTPQPWGLRALALAVLGAWFVPLTCAALDLASRERERRSADIDALVQVEVLRAQEVDVARDLREEIRIGVVDALDPLRVRVDTALEELEAGWPMAEPVLSEDLRRGADASVRPLSRDLHRSAAARYPRVRWEQVIVQTVRTQPFRPLLLVMLGLVGDGVFVLARQGLRDGLPYVVVTAAAVGGTSQAANALMRRFPRHHAALFLLGLATFLALGLAALAFQVRVWGSSAYPSVAAAAIISAAVGIVVVLVTSGFGTWRSEMEAMRSAFRADVDAEYIAAQARSRQLADIARDAARVLHGSVQSRLVACAMAIDRASGDRHALQLALIAARDALSEPLPASGLVAGSIGEEVRRKVGLWGSLCRFRVIVDPRVEDVPADSLVVGRVVEEGLVNAIRHGAATEVAVTVAPDGEGVLIVVADDGRGPGEVTAGLGSALLDQVTGGAWTLRRRDGWTELRARIPAARAISAPRSMPSVAATSGPAPAAP